MSNIRKLALERLDKLVKPIGSLGKLESLSAQLCEVYGNLKPEIKNPALIVMCADHHVVDEGVASAPPIVTQVQSVNIAGGLSGVGAIANKLGIKTYTVDIGINSEHKLNELIDKRVKNGADNICKGPAMTRQEAQRCIDVGIEMAEKAVKDGSNLLLVGEMGIGNTTPTTAIVALLDAFEKNCSEGSSSSIEITIDQVLALTGVGANLPIEQLPLKAETIKTAIEINRPDPQDGLDVLSKIGGLEIAGMAGVMLGAHKMGVPVILDGYISTAAALMATTIEPACKTNIIPSHKSYEKGAARASQLLGVQPYLDMSMRLGEGSGAVLAVHICKAACAIMTDMATFEQSGIKSV